MRVVEQGGSDSPYRWCLGGERTITKIKPIPAGTLFFRRMMGGHLVAADLRRKKPRRTTITKDECGRHSRRQPSTDLQSLSSPACHHRCKNSAWQATLNSSLVTLFPLHFHRAGPEKTQFDQRKSLLASKKKMRHSIKLIFQPQAPTSLLKDSYYLIV